MDDLGPNPFEGTAAREETKTTSKTRRARTKTQEERRDREVARELEQICGDRKVEVQKGKKGRKTKIVVHPPAPREQRPIPPKRKEEGGRQASNVVQDMLDREGNLRRTTETVAPLAQPTSVPTAPKEKRSREEGRDLQRSGAQERGPKGRARKATRTTEVEEEDRLAREAVGPRPAAHHARVLENLDAPRMYIGAARIGPLPLPVRVRFSPHSTVNLMSKQMTEWLALQQDPLPKARRIQLPDGRRKEVKARVSAPTTLEVIGSSPHDEVVTFEVVNDEATGIVLGQEGCATFQLRENMTRTQLVTRGQITRGWLDHTSLDA